MRSRGARCPTVIGNSNTGVKTKKGRREPGGDGQRTRLNGNAQQWLTASTI